MKTTNLKVTNNLYRAFYTVLCSLFLLTSCKKDKDDGHHNQHENELITTLKLNFTDSANTSNTFSAVFKDADGPGGNPPAVFDTIHLQSSSVYYVSIEFLDESAVNHTDTITDEIEEEDYEHLICFTPAGLSITINRTDSDGKYEVGLLSKWATITATGLGTVKMELKHQPGVKNGSCDPGETDVDVSFQTEII